MATTQLEIVNLTGIEFGEKPLTAVDDTTKLGEAAGDAWADTRDWLLARHPWNFALRRAELAAVEAFAPAYDWSTGYLLPDGNGSQPKCLRALRAGRELDGYDVDWVAEEGVLRTGEHAYPSQLLENADDLSAADWTATNASVNVNHQLTVPFGYKHGDLLTDTSAVANGVIVQTETVADDTGLYTFAAALKASSASYATLNIGFSGGATPSALNYIELDFSDASLLTYDPQALIHSYGREDLGGGWYRPWLTVANNGGGNTTLTAAIYPTGSLSDSASATTSVWVSRPQLYQPALLPVEYIRQVTDVARWSPGFVTAMAARLAWVLQPRMEKSSRARRDELDAAFARALREATGNDGQEGVPRPHRANAWRAARGAGHPGFSTARRPVR